MSDTSKGYKRFWIFLVFLMVVSAVPYLNTLKNELTNWDDQDLIEGNPYIRNFNMDKFKYIITHRVRDAYLPVRLLSYAIDYRLWGLNTVGYHIENIIFQAINCCLFYLLVLKILSLTERYKKWGIKNILNFSFIAGLFFALHPMHVESVTWLSARKDVLSGTFFSLSLYLYILSKEDYKKNVLLGLYIGALISFGLAMLSKATTVILPGIILIIDWLIDPQAFRKGWGRILGYIPFAILSLALVSVNIYVAEGSGNIKAFTFHASSPAMHYFYALMAFILGVGKVILPVNLCAHYYLDISNIAITAVFYSAILLAVLILIAVKGVVMAYKGDRLLLFAILWYIIALIPASNIIPISTLMADRYLYLSLAGSALLFASLIISLSLYYNRIKFITGFLCLIIFLCYGILTLNRNYVWKDAVTLWEDCIRKCPENTTPHHNLGCYLSEMMNEYEWALAEFYTVYKKEPDHFRAMSSIGRVLDKMKRPDLGIKWNNMSLEKQPNHYNAYYNLGNIYSRMGDYDKAVQNFLRVTELNAEYAPAWCDLGATYVQMADMEEAVAEKYLKKARYCLTKAAYLRPDMPEIFCNLAAVYNRTAKIDNDDKLYKQALALSVNALRSKPGLKEAYIAAGDAYTGLSRFQEAEKAYLSAYTMNKDKNDLSVLRHMAEMYIKKEDIDGVMKIKDKYPGILNVYSMQIDIGRLYMKMDRPSDAKLYFKNAVNIASDRPDAYKWLGNAVRREGDNDSALKYYEKALELTPRKADIMMDIGSLYISTGRYSDAVEIYKKALALEPESASLYNEIGTAYYKNNQTDEAEKAYKRALELDPGLVEANLNLGNVYMNKDMLDEAEDRYKRIIEIAPYYADAHGNIGVVYIKRYQKTGGIKWRDIALLEWETCVKLDPSNNRIRSYLDMAKHEIEKNKIFEKALTPKQQH